MITMNDFRAEPDTLKQELLGAFQRVMESGWYVLGPELKSFEAAWARSCQLDHCVGVANGLDAIEIGLRASGVGPGDEVITTPMTAFATVLGILRAGAIPVLADIDPLTGLLDPDSAERCISPRTRGVLLVHLYGHIAQMDRWLDLCRRHHIQLFEDCAQAHLSQWQGKTAGSLGSWGAYSFYPTKNLGALGDAGALVTHSPELAQISAQLRNYGQKERYHHPLVGMNSRLDELQAALLSVRLNWLREFTEARRRIATRYQSEIDNRQVHLLRAPQEQAQHVYHLFVVTCERRQALLEHLQKKGIEALIHYPLPIHFQEPCRDISRDPQGLKAAETHASICLSLPCHPFLKPEAVSQVIDAVNSFD